MGRRCTPINNSNQQTFLRLTLHQLGIKYRSNGRTATNEYVPTRTISSLKQFLPAAVPVVSLITAALVNFSWNFTESPVVNISLAPVGPPATAYRMPDERGR